MISFCVKNGVTRLDMRTVGGRNLLGMTLQEVADISAKIDAAKIQVPTFVSPLMKWAAPGSQPAAATDDFVFDPATCPDEDFLEYGCDVAGVLGAPKMSFCSYLRHDGFQPQGALLKAIERLMDLSGHHVTEMHLENELACNLGSIAELADFFRRLPEMLAILDAARTLPIMPLPDIGDSYIMNQPPSDADIAILAPHIKIIHLKDQRDGKIVPFGDGEIPWAKELERLLKDVRRAPTLYESQIGRTPEVIASIETRCPQNAGEATARSIEGLRRIAREIGIEVI
jgi:sugar phosphate isomerase/epimerase